MPSPVFDLQSHSLHSDGALPAQRYVWHGVAGKDGGEYPAVTLSVTKKPGENAIDVTRSVLERIEMLRGTFIPDGVEVTVTEALAVIAHRRKSTARGARGRRAR